MIAPLIWILFPLGCSALFGLFRARKNLILLLATILALILALGAWLIPIGQTFHILGSRAILVEPELALAGRRLLLENHDRPFLIFIYLLCAFWFSGAGVIPFHRSFPSVALGIVVAMVAAHAVVPTLYAALLVEVAVLMAIPLLAPPGKPFGQGLLRFLIFQTLAMPFILLAGWALGAVEANPTNTTLITLAMVFLGLGFAFWLAVFPFYSWLPLLSEQSQPYMSGFVFVIFLSFNLLLGIGFLDQYGWLRSTPVLYDVLRLIGVIMVATAGIWAAFSKNLARLFGYGVIVETGFSILAMSLGSHLGNELFASMFLTRLIAFGMWSLALSIILTQAPSTRFEDVRGLSSRLPIASIALAVSSLSVAGLPLLGEFPIRQVLMEEISRQSLAAGLGALVGTMGMLFATFRSVAELARGSFKLQTVCETRRQSILLIMGVVGLLAIGILPQVLLALPFPLLWSYPRLP